MVIALTILIIVENIFFVRVYKKLAKKFNSETIEKKNKRIELIDFYILRLRCAKTLREIYALHLAIWANGIQHEYFGPNEYGMFRTKDILLMNPEEVYLGNVWGLNTLKLTQWETKSEDVQKLVIEQYKNHLIGNLIFLKSDGTK